MYKIQCGIYVIVNIINQKLYFGSSINIRKRLNLHYKQLKNNNHHSIRLQRSYNKYGIENFQHFIMEENIKPELLQELEQRYIDLYESYKAENGYNILKFTHNSTGYKHSEESKQIISNKKKGRKIHPNTMTAILKANIGSKKSKETREAIGKANKGKIVSEKTRKLISVLLTGKFMPHKRKILKYDYNFKLDKIYSSLEECSKDINLSMSQIRTICNGRSIQKKEYILMYEHYPIKWNRTNRKLELKWR